MKELITIFGTFLIASVVLTSCGGVEADAEKICDLGCEADALMKKALEDPTNTDLMSKAEKLEEDGEATIKELKEKYKDDEDGKKALLAELAKCDCN